MIFADVPGDWKELERHVEQILRECGCQVERSKHVELPRGVVDLDVFALDTTREPTLTIACECKHWGTNVPKTVVHAFRTVVEEIGAHVGIIIAAGGFQSGAIEAARNTNIELVTWDQFQSRFYDRWFAAMSTKLIPIADEIFDYSDYFHPRTTNVLHAIPERVQELQTLWRRFSSYAAATSFCQFIRKDAITFPLDIIDPRSRDFEMITIADARTYFDLLLSSAPQAIAEYESFIAKYERADADANRGGSFGSRSEEGNPF